MDGSTTLPPSTTIASPTIATTTAAHALTPSASSSYNEIVVLTRPGLDSATAARSFKVLFARLYARPVLSALWVWDAIEEARGGGLGVVDTALKSPLTGDQTTTE